MKAKSAPRRACRPPGESEKVLIPVNSSQAMTVLSQRCVGLSDTHRAHLSRGLAGNTYNSKQVTRPQLTPLTV
jgi:hypothetical protein